MEVDRAQRAHSVTAGAVRCVVAAVLVLSGALVPVRGMTAAPAHAIDALPTVAVDDGAGVEAAASPTSLDGAGSEASPAVGDPWVAAIDRLVAEEPGVYGIVLMRPDGTVLYRRNADLPFVAASLYKLVLLVDICRAIDDGTISPDDALYVDPSYFDPADGIDSYFDESYAGLDTTVEEALLATGAYSSNVAAKALMNLTTVDDLMQTADDLGLTGTFVEVDPVALGTWPPTPTADTRGSDAETAGAFVLGYAYDGIVNLTTPMDMARYFRLLLNGELINERVSRMVGDILAQQMIDNRFPVLLPDGTRTIHKTGNLDLVVHDAGIIYGKDGPVILVAMSEGAPDEDRATQIEQRLALIAYGEYDVPAIVPATPVPTTVPEEPAPMEGDDYVDDTYVDETVPENSYVEEPVPDDTYVDESAPDAGYADDTYVEDPVVDDGNTTDDGVDDEAVLDPEAGGT